ncbi:MAG: 3'(2'),5'-bisphosphate nucleotidase [Alphaproteobacteria bacterium]|nr:3'(2'),5'-bisphosphate nucleotidase [Alphaproteobacteria bacterium]
MALEVAKLLPAVAAAARRAGAAVLEHYESEFAVTRKTDGSPVTAADHASEAVMLEALHRLTPDIPVVSEEEVEAGRFPNVSGGRFWLVDPLDGTKEFVKRNGEFAVVAGLVVDFKAVAGVIYAPVLDSLYAGGSGEAWRETGGQREVLSARIPAEDGLVVAISRSHTSEKFETYLKTLPLKGRVLCGSAIKFGLLAAGEADLYPRFGQTMEWDTAAGHAILEAAGGRVEAKEGGPLLYGKPKFFNNGFIARGRAA